MKKLAFLSLSFCILLQPIFADTIHLTGSQSAANFLLEKITQFEKKSGHTVEITKSNSNLGFLSVQKGHIGLVTRNAIGEETNINLNLVQVGKEACLVIVNFHNPLTSISQTQVKDIFSGKLDSWLNIHKEFDYPFNAYGPNINADSYSLITQTWELDKTTYETNVTAARADKKALRYVAIKPGGIGVVTRSTWQSEQLLRSEYVKILYVDGIEAKQSAVDSGFYPLSVPVYLAAPKNLTKAKQDLIAFLSDY